MAMLPPFGVDAMQYDMDSESWRHPFVYRDCWRYWRQMPLLPLLEQVVAVPGDVANVKCI